MDERTEDVTDNDTETVRWMTFAELAKVRGITAASATQLAFRRKWRRQGGDDKTARVAVPIGEITPKTDTPRMVGVMSGGDIARAITALESALAELHDRAESTEKRADRAEARALTAEAEATASRERADKEVSVLRAQIEAERGRAARAEAEVAVLRGQITAERDLAVATHNRIAVEIEALRQRDRERRELGTLKRLRAAWRRE